MGYIVPFLTISSILIDVCFTNVIFIGVIFNSYNYWYLLSYSTQLSLHYSILFLIISIIIIVFFYYYIKCYIKLAELIVFIPVANYSLILNYNLISYSFFSNFSFFIPIFLDFFLILSIFFFKYIINSIEVFTGFNPCYGIFFFNLLSLFFYIQFTVILILAESWPLIGSIAEFGFYSNNIFLLAISL